MEALGDLIPVSYGGSLLYFESIKAIGQPHELALLFVRFVCIAAVGLTPGSGTLETRCYTNIGRATLSMRSSAEEESMRNEGDAKAAFLGDLSR